MRKAKSISNSVELPNQALITVVFFFSGVVALVYEVLWQRRFALVFGSSATATAAVLAAYFAGLAFGSWGVFSSKAARLRPLRLYAMLECGIAVGAILVEILIHGFDQIQTVAGGGLWLKMIEAFVCLALPTYCMGRTLPVLGAFVDQRREHLGQTAGLLYVVNTAGAALGTLVIPFFLLPWLGMRGAVVVCVMTNLFLAAVAWRLDRSPSVVRELGENEPPIKNWPFIRYGLLAFISGFCSFVAQVQWNRAFAQVHENSLYSFAVIVAMFILALAVGGQIARVLLRCRFTPERVLCWSWIISGALVMASPWLFLWLTRDLTYIVGGSDWRHYAGRLIELAGICVFPSALLMGVAFPVILELGGRTAPGRPGRILSALLCINLIGAVVGALMAGFLVPRILGLWPGLIYAGMLLIAAVIGEQPDPRRSALAIPAILSMLVILRIDLPRTHVASDRGEKLVGLSEGAHGIIAVVERGNSRRLKLNNSYVLGGTASTGDERMQSHLPLLLHPKPRSIAYMGLGTGISAGGALFHPVEKVTILELAPEVAEAARKHFADANMKVLDDPKTRLILEDARNYLRHTDEKFDMIIGDLVVPWKAGEAALFTRENFEAGRRALAQGGIYCQWVPLFQLSEEEFQIVLKTFLSVFAEAWVLRGDFSPNEPAIGLVGISGTQPTRGIVSRRLSEMKRDPKNPQLMDEFAFWMSVLGTTAIGNVGTERINSENRPWIELLAPMNHAGEGAGSLFVGRALQRWSRTVVTPIWFDDTMRAGMRAGDYLSEFTLSISEGKQTEAEKAQAEIEKLAPPELFRILFPK